MQDVKDLQFDLVWNSCKVFCNVVSLQLCVSCIGLIQSKSLFPKLSDTMPAAHTTAGASLSFRATSQTVLSICAYLNSLIACQLIFLLLGLWIARTAKLLCSRKCSVCLNVDYCQLGLHRLVFSASHTTMSSFPAWMIRVSRPQNSLPSSFIFSACSVITNHYKTGNDMQSHAQTFTSRGSKLQVAVLVAFPP